MPNRVFDQLMQEAAARNRERQFLAAVTCLRRAIDIRPDAWEAWLDLGDALMNVGDPSGAHGCYERSASLNMGEIARKRLAASFNDLANFTKGKGFYTYAVNCYQRALGMQPDHPDILYNLAQVLWEMGETTQALPLYRRVLALAPEHILARWAYAMAQIPLLLNKPEDQAPSRQAFANELQALDKWFDARRSPFGHRAISSMNPFYLAYQEANNRELMSMYGDLCVRLMSEWQKNNNWKQPASTRTKGPVRLGIVSCHVRNHSVWFAILKGILENLNPKNIEIELFSTDPRQDDETAWAKNHVKKFHFVGEDVNHAAQTVITADLDVLFYPQIGIEGHALQKLACLRLCPVQIVGWGHPETSGLPTIDYYLSAEAFEPVSADNAYTEKLVRLPNLGCCYHAPAVTIEEPDLAYMGITTGVPLLLSPGTPYKYTPQHDHTFVDIAKKLKNCQIVFFTCRPQDISNRLQARLRAAFTAAGLDFDATCKFIPWLDRPLFYGLMKQADVFLDTIGFSGFNTAMQAIECDLPIVTHEGEFMRGRLGSGILRSMKLNETIAKDSAAYVDIAVRLASDATYRKKIRKSIQSKRDALFGDVKPVQALEKLLLTFRKK